MPLISQNSLQWKTLALWVTQSLVGTQIIRLNPDQWWSVMTSEGVIYKYLFKFPGTLLYKMETGVWPQFSKEGAFGEAKPQKRRVYGWEVRLYTKGVFLKIPNKMCFVTSSDGDLWKISYILNKFVFFFIQKIKNIGVIVWLICNFWSKTQNTWDLWATDQTFRGNWARNENKKGVIRALHSVPTNMGVPSGFISNYNLNFIKYLLVISSFATFAGGHRSILMNTLSAQTKVEILGTEQKF